MLKQHFPILLAGLLMVAVSSAPAGADGQSDAEIAFLLETIARSPCRFIRNGVAYPAGDAHAHILKKYGYAKPRIKNAEDFIRHAATRSSISGEPYRIRCNGQEVLCADWLREALARYRGRDVNGAP